MCLGPGAAIAKSEWRTKPRGLQGSARTSLLQVSVVLSSTSSVWPKAFFLRLVRRARLLEQLHQWGLMNFVGVAEWSEQGVGKILLNVCAKLHEEEWWSYWCHITM
jgi:hypothetical protein